MVLEIELGLNKVLQLEPNTSNLNLENVMKIIVKNAYVSYKYTDDFQKYISNYEDNHFLTNCLLNDEDLHVVISIPSAIYSFVKREMINDNYSIYKEIIKISNEDNIFDFLMKKYKVYNKKNIFEDIEIFDFLYFVLNKKHQ